MAARLENPELAVVLTPMRRRHLRGVLRIEGQVYPRPWSLGLFTGELALTDSRVYVVARISGTVAGYSGLMVVAEDGHITTIAVDPEWQRHGLATNRNAQELYRKFGFAPAGIRRGYYVDNREDALVMWVHDVQSEEYAERLSGIRAGIEGMTIVEGFEAK